ncbi:MAG: patatin-like phospholipase family protein [Pirellulales bacterium]
MAKSQDESFSIFSFIDGHLFTLLATFLGIFVIFQVPQISHLWMQWPISITESVGFLLMFLMLLVLYPVTLVWIWQRTTFRFQHFSARQRFIEFVQRHKFLIIVDSVVFKFPRLATSMLAKIVIRSKRYSQGPIAWVLILLIAIIGMWMMMRVPLALGLGPITYPLMGCFVRMVGFWLVFLSFWLALGQYYGVENVLDEARDFSNLTTEDRQRWVWRATSRVLSWMAVVNIIGELLWIAGSLEIPLASYRLYSVWAAFHIPAIVVGIMIVVDFAQVITGSKWRMICVLFLVFMMVVPGLFDSQLNDPSGSTKKPLSVTAERKQPSYWMDAFENKIDQTKDGPVVFVAASGGGSRAALFASLVLQQLSIQPMTWGDSEKTWGDNVVLISSVSGGSIATARYMADVAHAKDTTGQLRFTSKEELKLRTTERIDGLSNLSDENKELLKTAISKPDRNNDVGKAVLQAFGSTITDEMAADFMAPILRGSITPFANRGDCLYGFWDQLYGWSAKDQSYFSTLHLPGRDLQKSLPPLAFLNTTDVVTGRRVILGFPNIEAGFLVGSPEFPITVRESAVRSGRTSTYDGVSISDYVCNTRSFEVSLTRAVRLSSNFPWGFDIERFSEKSEPALIVSELAPKARGQKARRYVELMDGGVVDNTGIDSIASMLESVIQRADADPKSQAARIYDKLRRRGVVLIEIDSGAKPSVNESDGRASGALVRPITALGNSSYTNSLRIGDELVEDMLTRFHSPSLLAINLAKKVKVTTEFDFAAALGSSLPENDVSRDPISSIFHYRFTCSNEQLDDLTSDVMTALALGPDDKAAVFSAFLAEWIEWNERVEGEAESYKRLQRLLDLKSTSNQPPESIIDEIAILRELNRRIEYEQKIVENKEIGDNEKNRSKNRLEVMKIALSNFAPSIANLTPEQKIFAQSINPMMKSSEVASFIDQVSIEPSGESYEASVRKVLPGLKTTKDQLRDKVNADLKVDLQQKRKSEK